MQVSRGRCVGFESLRRLGTMLLLMMGHLACRIERHCTVMIDPLRYPRRASREIVQCDEEWNVCWRKEAVKSR